MQMSSPFLKKEKLNFSRQNVLAFFNLPEIGKKTNGKNFKFHKFFLPLVIFKKKLLVKNYNIQTKMCDESNEKLSAVEKNDKTL